VANRPTEDVKKMHTLNGSRPVHPPIRGRLPKRDVFGVAEFPVPSVRSINFDLLPGTLPNLPVPDQKYRWIFTLQALHSVLSPNPY